MNTELSQKDRVFWLQWTVTGAITTLAGAMLAFTIMWGVAEVVEDALGETAAALVAGAIFGALIGVGISVGQAIVLRGRGINHTRWIVHSALFSAIGSAVAWFAVFALMDVDTMPEAIAGVVMGLAVGLPLGIGQWLVLRIHLKSTNLWVPATALALTIAFVAALPLSGEGRELLALGTFSLLAAAFTGVAMTWMLRRQTAVAV
jgi:hypothetical protein